MVEGEVVEISLMGTRPDDRGRREPLLGGRVLARTPQGVSPLNRLLIEGLAEVPEVDSALTLLLPDALPALAFAGVFNKPVGYYHVDLYRAEMAREAALHNQCEGLSALCAANVPEWEPAPGLALFAFGQNSETALVCEMLRQARAHLATGGRILAAAQNPRDTWLRNQLEKIFGNLSVVTRDKQGILYSSKKKGGVEMRETLPPEEWFIRQTPVIWNEQRFDFETCYGTFCSSALDMGSLALLETFQPPASCASILDIGCGWGAMGLLAASRLRPKRLTMVDANARSVEMARRNAARYPLAENIEVRLEANVESVLYDGLEGEVDAYDLVLSNPPYGSEFRVSELFLRAAHRALRPGGEAWFVAKTNPLLRERMEGWFGSVEEIGRRGYRVFHARKVVK